MSSIDEKIREVEANLCRVDRQISLSTWYCDKVTFTKATYNKSTSPGIGSQTRTTKSSSLAETTSAPPRPLEWLHTIPITWSSPSLSSAYTSRSPKTHWWSKRWGPSYPRQGFLWLYSILPCSAACGIFRPLQESSACVYTPRCKLHCFLCSALLRNSFQ